ncbi:hypothetical protein PINS_up010111 [Pythium insidiosum]|nr:hypothetical protein PINS_up010111 [Pythium insidiosum]
MTITTRSKRVSMFGAAPTPATVGPGAYAPEQTVTSFRVEPRPLHSGFATSEKRDLNANKTTSAITPGPGAYVGADGHKSPAPPLSNVFATKISRFAPSAPGSTIYRPSSIQDNPGPGAYLVGSPDASSHRGGNNNQLEDARPTAAIVPLLRPSVPTIPKKEQSYGYVPNEHGELTLQQQPAAIYSGIGQDTVGPAAYNAHAQIWNDKKNVAPSLKSTVKREVWQENTPRRELPGPGQYDSGDATASFPAHARGASKLRQSAVFASKVPILPDAKPVAQHDAERELELLAKEQRAQLHRSAAAAAAQKAVKVEAFGSTSQRTDLLSQLSAPFSSPTFLATPGPGKYTQRTAAHSLHISRASRSRAFREQQHIGFASATQRHCLSKPKPSSSPGPGAYRSETPRTVERAVKGRQTVGRFGVFGSNAERRVWETLERLEPDEVTPGPGAYDKPVDTHGGHFPLLVSSAAFKSSSSRFAKRANPHAPPHVHCVGNDATPAVGDYDITRVHAIAATLVDATAATAAAGAGAATDSSGLVSPRAPFLSTVDRRVFDAKESRLVPGPGQYAVEPPGDGGRSPPLTRMHEVRATLGNEERFRVKPTVPEHVGPGSYAIPGTVGTRSFNVTMVAKADGGSSMKHGRPRRSSS